MNKIEVKCCINGEPEMGNSSLYVARTESWEQVLYKISLKVNKPQGPNSIVYNELGGQITSVSELEDGDKIYFSVNGEAFVPPASSGNRFDSDIILVAPNNVSATPAVQAAASHDSAHSNPSPVPATTFASPPLAVPTAYTSEKSSTQQPQQCVVKPADGPTKYVMRFIIVGSMSVGKSCLLLQFTNRRFAANVGPTIGVDFGSSSLNIDGENVKLQIWDTAGQEDFQAITRAYYREAAAAILVYDMTNLQSYEKLQSWLSAVQSNSTNPNIVITLVGNKNDVKEEDKVVSYADGEAFAKANGLMFLETSAKTGYNVDNVFILTAREIIKRIKSGAITLGDKDGVKVNGQQSNSQKITGVAESGAEAKKKCC